MYHLQGQPRIKPRDVKLPEAGSSRSDKTPIEDGRFQRWIARELGVHRRTLKCYSKEQSDPKCTISRIGRVGRPSHCEAYRQRIEKQLDLGLSAQRIYQDLKVECGFLGSYASVQRFVKKLKEEQPTRVWRFECGPGEEAQEDYRPKWYERLLVARPEAVVEVQVRFAASEFRTDSTPPMVASAGK